MIGAPRAGRRVPWAGRRCATSQAQGAPSAGPGGSASRGGHGAGVSVGCGSSVLFTHGGGIPGYSANLYHFPEEGLSIAVLANAKGRDDGRAPVDLLARAIASECFGRDACGPDVPL